ncbi:MFS transporter [Haloarcula marina]|uniref:MFS transporter n=1 Tax=Haloarcula marina TaxID=2961574 RepID=UPI0020B733C5|nr:MFS transporter [Halomicroarcula marina]
MWGISDRRQKLAVVFGIVVVDLLGWGIVVPILPLYAQHFGASEFVAGLLFTSYAGAQFVFAPLLGRLSDQYGRRPVLLVSVAGSVVAWTLFGLSSVFGGLLLLFASRILAGVMGGNIAAAQAYIADIMPPEKRAKGLGLIGAAFGVGFLFGPSIGAVTSSPAVVDAVGGLSVIPAFVPINEFSLPGFVAAVLSLVNLLVGIVILPETNTGQNESGAETTPETARLAAIRQALGTPVLGGLLVAYLLVWFAFASLESQFVLFTGDIYGYGTATNGYLFTYLALVATVVQATLVGPLSDRVGVRRLAALCLAVLACSFVALPFSRTIATVTPSLAVPLVGTTLSADLVALGGVLTPIAASYGLSSILLETLISGYTDEGAQGGMFGVVQSTNGLSRTLGPGIAGGLYTGVAYWAPFVAGGLALVPATIVLLQSEAAVDSHADGATPSD